MGGVYSSLNRKRGTVVEETNRPGTPMYNVKAYLPVAESFGFTSFLRQNTAGQAFPQMVFHHWDVVNGDPWEDDKVKEIVLAGRKRKGGKGGRAGLPMPCTAATLAGTKPNPNPNP